MKEEDILNTFKTAICEELGLLSDEYLIENESDRQQGKNSFAFIVYCRLTKYHFKEITARRILTEYVKVRANGDYTSTAIPYIFETLWEYEMDEEEKGKYHSIGQKVSYMLSERFMNDYLRYNEPNTRILKAS